MPESAAIIPFPARPNPPSAVVPSQTKPPPGEVRLAHALAGLNDAVTAQRAAVAAWKSSLSDLSSATGRLGASLRGYNDTLGKLDARVATLRGEAKKLEAWSDGVSFKEG